jgi:hypothetical protein
MNARCGGCILAKNNLKIISVGLIYLIYAITHLFIYYYMRNNIISGTILHEAQYLINYSFAILNLFIYLFIFYKEDTAKIKKYTLIAMIIYISSIYVSIITSTYSTTYVEGIGIKGWFESGNSLGSILILGLFILFSILKFPNKNNKKDFLFNLANLIIILLTGFYLIKLIGTRTRIIRFYFCYFYLFIF